MSPKNLDAGATFASTERLVLDWAAVAGTFSSEKTLDNRSIDHRLEGRVSEYDNEIPGEYVRRDVLGVASTVYSTVHLVQTHALCTQKQMS